MRIHLGRICIMLGPVLILGALGLFLFNMNTSADAEAESTEVLLKLHQAAQKMTSINSTAEQIPLKQPIKVDQMTEVVIDGNSYIGYLAVPDLELELPVMSDWSYSGLKISPCRYCGTVKGNDLVIMAHNYKSHFGNLSKLPLGTIVWFSDMDGNQWCYEIGLIETLEPSHVDEMTAGEYDLTLFTCTSGGSHRVAIRCNLSVQ